MPAVPEGRGEASDQLRELHSEGRRLVLGSVLGRIEQEGRDDYVFVVEFEFVEYGEQLVDGDLEHEFFAEQ